MEKKKKIMIASVVGALVLIGVGIGSLYYEYSSRIYTTCFAEAGTEIVAEDFLKDGTKEATFAENSEDNIDIHVPGTYTVSVKSGIFTYSCNLIIQDTVAPTALGTEVYTEFGKTVSPEQFVTDVLDETEITFAFAEEPNFKQYGKQNITIMLTDLGGNTFNCEASLIVCPIVKELTIEAGSEIPVLEDFLLTDNLSAHFLSSMDGLDTTILQDCEIDIEVNDVTYKSILHIVDTIAPVIEVQNLSAYTTSLLSAEDFVTTVEDMTTVKYSFKQEPNYLLTDVQNVTICAIDEGGNVTEKTAQLTLQEDTEPPIIKASDMTANLGSSVSYRNNASVMDNCDKDISLSVDSSQVNVNVVGTYSVIYSATDRAGNTTTKTVTLTIRQRSYDQDEVYALCDKVLANIITDGMSEYDKLSAIYYWIRGNVTYINHSDKISWVQGAYEGLALHKGDCYVFACTAKALLSRAGIKNADITKIPAKTQHFWNVVDIGEGWRHFDTCPRKDKSVFLYMTDEDLMNYSNAHDGSHNYDRSIYTYFEDTQT